MTTQNVFDENEVSMILQLKERAAMIFNRSELNSTFKDAVVLAGGCFASWFHREKPKDHDVFIFGNLQRLVEVKNYIKAVTPNKLDDVTDEYKRNNDKIYGVINDHTGGIQYIYTSYNSREELVRDFDFVHTMVSYHMDKIYITRQIYDAVANKQLIVNNDNRVAEWRRNKFLQRGYTEPTKEEEKFVPWSKYSTNIAADAIAAKLMKETELNGQ